jgi:hypothetical protein
MIHIAICGRYVWRAHAYNKEGDKVRSQSNDNDSQSGRMNDEEASNRSNSPMAKRPDWMSWGLSKPR